MISAFSDPGGTFGSTSSPIVDFGATEKRPQPGTSTVEVVDERARAKAVAPLSADGGGLNAGTTTLEAAQPDKHVGNAALANATASAVEAAQGNDGVADSATGNAATDTTTNGHVNTARPHQPMVADNVADNADAKKAPAPSVVRADAAFSNAAGALALAATRRDHVDATTVKTDGSVDAAAEAAALHSADGERPHATVEEDAGVGTEVNVVTSPEIPREIDVRSIRDRLGMTQEDFAQTFGLSVASLRNWEQGTRTPERPIALYLRLIDRFPEQVKEEVVAARGVH